MLSFIKKSQRGDTLAFQKIIEEFQGYAYSLAYRFLGNHEDSKDVTQDVFIRIWQHIKKYNSRYKFSTWMYRITVNLCLDQIRKNKRRQKGGLKQFEIYKRETLAAQSSSEKDSINELLFETISDLSRNLTPKQRSVFVLRDLEDLDMDDVAAALEMSRHAVKSNLYHARKNIREKLEKIESIWRKNNVL